MNTWCLTATVYTHSTSYIPPLPHFIMLGAAYQYILTQGSLNDSGITSVGNSAVKKYIN